MIQSFTYWLLLAGAVLVHWRLPERWRLPFLALASCAYLVSLQPAPVAMLLGWAALFYYLPPLAKERGWKRIASILTVAIVGFLFWWKYLPAIQAALVSEPALRVAVPIGISYYTVKLIHYALEVTRGKLPPHRFADFACYVLFVPIFTAGPVERFDQFMARRETAFKGAMAVEGVTRIVHGLVKKFALAHILMAPRFGLAMGGDGLVAHLDDLPVWQVWGFFLLSYLYLYLDFSAYSDIAIGSARLFGFRICENFNWPLAATNIGDFWRRWHMSLSAWCRTYVYMPMIGLTRNPYAASYASFIVMGIWHAPSLHWLAWGAYHASGVAFYTRWTQWRQRRKLKPWQGPFGKAAGWALTLLFLVGASTITSLDHAAGLHDMLRVCCKLLGLPLP